MNSTLTYSHCRPIQYIEAKLTADKKKYEVPSLLRAAYEDANHQAFDFYQMIVAINPRPTSFLYNANIGISYADGTFGVLNCTIQVRVDGGIVTHPNHKHDTLRVFPNKDIALKYAEKHRLLYTP